MPFQQVDDNVWLFERSIRFGPIPLPHTMTIVRLPNGGLFVHSPTNLDSTTAADLEALGTVDSIVWPSWWHDMYLREYAAAFPRAKLYGSPLLAKAQRSLVSLRVLDADAPQWAPCIDSLYVDRMRLFLDEFVFLHRPSRSLIVADLAFHVDEGRSPFTRSSFRFIGAYPGCNVPWVLKPGTKDRKYMRAKIDRILDWDFDRLIVGHADVVQTGGKDALRNAYRWLKS
jgi:hypothetical protein